MGRRFVFPCLHCGQQFRCHQFQIPTPPHYVFGEFRRRTEREVGCVGFRQLRVVLRWCVMALGIPLRQRYSTSRIWALVELELTVDELYMK